MIYGEERIYQDIAYASNRHMLKSIIEYLSNNQHFQYDLRKNYPTITPSGIDDILEELEWEREDFDANGWQQDTWYNYSHNDYNFGLIMEYGGFYGGLKLYRSDIDDE